MSNANARRLITIAESWGLVLAPALLLLVALFHFRTAEDFFDFRARYTPRPAAEVVAALIALGDRAPLFHEPHMIAYLGLPLLPLSAFGLYALGKDARPFASVVALSVTMVGVVYVGGLFGMWTAFFHGIPRVDARHLDGATATFAALTAPRGAFLLTTTLAKLSILGLLLQTLALLGARRVPTWAPLLAAAGYAVVAAFWDQDNWMLVGEVLILAGMWPLRSCLATRAETEDAAPPRRLESVVAEEGDPMRRES
jgi:heme A synthase